MLFRCSTIGLVALAAICISISTPVSVMASGPDNVGAAQGEGTPPAAILHADPTDPGAQPVQNTNSIGPDEESSIRATAEEYYYRDLLREWGLLISPRKLSVLKPKYTQNAHDTAYLYSLETTIPELVEYNRKMAARQGTPTGRSAQPAQETVPYATGEERSKRREADVLLFNEVKTWAGIEEPVPRARPEDGDTLNKNGLALERWIKKKNIEKAKKEGTFKKPYPIKLPDIHRVVLTYIKSQPLPVLVEYINRMTAHSVQGTQSGVTDKERQTRETAENIHFDELKAKKGDRVLDELEQTKLRLEAHIYAQLQPIASLKESNREVAASRMAARRMLPRQVAARRLASRRMPPRQMAARPTTSAGHNAQSTQGTSPGTAPGMSDERTTPTQSSEESASDLKA